MSAEEPGYRISREKPSFKRPPPESRGGIPATTNPPRNIRRFVFCAMPLSVEWSLEPASSRPFPAPSIEREFSPPRLEM
ncbi:hypothetical protein L596_014542 [Steinernema carpocapsae]|uniref:Uncharacterized protein n=1 Tax=Steinernema carpocapsae TaxID=34508 RepID=A0A4U5ND05_STECR|nr:hypothetical protein L596_014542 [Steinernema carpocapsae]